MPRLMHGATVRLDTFEVAGALLAGRSAGLARAFGPHLQVDLLGFDYLFPGLQGSPTSLLPDGATTFTNLVALGAAMRDAGPGGASDPGDSGVAAIYTYLGQFIDHDITLETLTAPLPDLLNPALQPLSAESMRATVRNLRTATLDLDSVYGPPAPRSGPRMVVGKVTPTPLPPGVPQPQKPFLRPAGKDDFNDLPREPRSGVPSHDRAALIGDPRNDENTIISQLHVAFLRAHNALIDQGRSFAQAQRLLRQHYQCIVIHDYLKRIADPQIVDGILRHGNRLYTPRAQTFFLPLEFAFAAFRFGHTMIRGAYNFNLNFNLSGEPGTSPASLGLLFTFSALSGGLGFGQGTDTLPDNWIVEWERLVDVGAPFDKARRFDTKLVEPLFQLPDITGQTLTPDDAARLATRNLLRGYISRMPTGQAVAQSMGLPALTGAEIEAEAATEDQKRALRDGGYLERTPLWYYLLAEAGVRAGGQHLGPVGSTIVAEVLIGLVRRSSDSILGRARWKPSLDRAQDDTFSLTDLLRLGGVLPRP